MSLLDMVKEFDFPKESTGTVDLTMDELEAGMLCGVRRCRQLIERGLIKPDSLGTNWSQFIESAVAEVVLAKYTNRYWDGNESYITGQDVGGKLKATLVKDESSPLVISQKDDPEASRVIVAILGKRTEPLQPIGQKIQECNVISFRVIGWYKAGAAQGNKDWEADGVFTVPHDALVGPDILVTENKWGK